jgi:hypothetical protein
MKGGRERPNIGCINILPTHPESQEAQPLGGQSAYLVYDEPPPLPGSAAAAPLAFLPPLLHLCRTSPTGLSRVPARRCLVETPRATATKLHPKTDPSGSRSKTCGRPILIIAQCWQASAMSDD